MRNELYANASFLCERLYAEVKNEDIKLLLAECYLGEGKAYKAYEILKDCSQNANRYKFALICLKLNKFQEAERALLNRRQARPIQQQESQQSLLSQVPNGAAGLYVLGQVYERQMKRREAVEMYKQALALDPTLWCAFERLCKQQIHQSDPSKIFNESHPSVVKTNQLIREYMMMGSAAQGTTNSVNMSP